MSRAKKSAPAASGTRTTIVVVGVIVLLAVMSLIAVRWRGPVGDHEGAPVAAADDGQIDGLDLSTLEPRVAQRIAEARQRVAAESESGFAWGRLGAVLDAHQLHEHAAEAYVRARELQPDEFRWHYNAAVVATFQEDPEASIPLFRAAVKRNPAYAPAYYRLGMMLMDVGQYAEAATALRAALTIDPQMGLAARALGRALLSAGDADGAVRILQQARAALPDDRDTAMALGQALYRTGKTAQAEALIEASRHLKASGALNDSVRQEIRALGISAALCSERARSYMAVGKADEAIAQLRIMLETLPEDPYVHTRLGMAQMIADRLPAAEQSLSKALELAPDLADARVHHGRLRMSRGDVAGAVQEFERALKTNPNHSSAHAKLAVARVRQDRKDEALHHFEQAALHGKPDAETFLNWAITLHDLGDAEGALARAGEAVDRDPQYAKGHFVLGYWHAQAGDHATALTHLKAARDEAPQDVQARVTLARSAAAIGDVGMAVAELRQVQILSPGHPSKAELERLQDRLAP